MATDTLGSSRDGNVILATAVSFTVVWTFAFIGVRVSVQKDVFAISSEYRVGKKKRSEEQTFEIHDST